MSYAPVVVFGYNRADKLKDLLESLEKNKNIEHMELYIFLDIPGKKQKKYIKFSEEVKKYVNDYQYHSKFKQVFVEVAEEHKGLANSIISGVTTVINKYGKVIVLEDDLIVSTDFLDYMQRALDFYRYYHNVWSISGYCIDMENGLRNYRGDVFLLPCIGSWGWATWKNRWNKTDWTVASYSKFKNNLLKRAAFDMGGSDLSKMLDLQMKNSEFDSWAIRWGYQQFLERKYTVYPVESRVIHCGNDDRSTHGAYFNTQQLKENYSKCRFMALKPNWKLIYMHQKARRHLGN